MLGIPYGGSHRLSSRPELGLEGAGAKTSQGLRKRSLQVQLNHYLNIHSTGADLLQTLSPQYPGALGGSYYYSHRKKLRLR